MTTLVERLAKLPRTRRKKVEDRAKTLIAEETSLQDLRKARKQTQVRNSGSTRKTSPVSKNAAIC